MICARRPVLLMFVLVAATACQTSFLSPQQPKETPVFQGRPLQYWVSQATAKNGPNNLDKTVAALREAVLSDDPGVKQTAGDALAALGPKAKATWRPCVVRCP